MSAQAATSTPAIDLLAPENHGGDPWPLYTWLREEAPLYWDPINELWAVSRYDDVVAVARNPDTFTSTEGNVPKLPGDPSFINLDGKEHLRRRGLINHLFTKRAVAKMEEHIRDATDKLIDDVIESGRCDLVHDITRKLPLQITCEMLGIPEAYWADVCDWMDTFTKGGQGPEHVTMEVNEAFLNFGGLHMMLADERRIEPRDDLLSIWVHADMDGTQMDEDQLLFEHTMMLVGGSETARNAASGGLEMLASLPDQRRWLLDHPEDIVTAAEESIRWVSPFIRMARTVTKPVELHGLTMQPGDEVMMFYPPANRDPRVFADPDRFDVRRVFKRKMLAFGHGRHMCLGAHLARAEVKIVFERILARMPDFRVEGASTWSVNSFLRGPLHVPLVFSPGPRTH